MPRFFQSYETEVLALQSWQQRQGQIQAVVDSITPEQIATISAYGRMFPTVPPGIVRSLAQAGITPDHPVSQFAITQQQYRNMEERGSWHGDTTRRRPLDPTQIGEVNRSRRVERALQVAEEEGLVDEESGALVYPDDPEQNRLFWRTVRTLGQVVDEVPYIRNGTVMAHNRSTGLDYAIDPATGEFLEGVEETELGMTRDTFMQTEMGQQWQQTINDIKQGPAYQIPFEPGSPEAIAQQYTGQRIAAETELVSSTSGPEEAFEVAQQGLSLPVGGEGIVRPVFAALDAPVQALQGQVRNVHALVTGAPNPSAADFLNPFSQTDIGIAIPQLIRGEEVDMGSGFFVDPESAVARERRRREAERGQIGGHNVTLGRWIASSVTEPDTTPFRIISGLVDASVQIADPSAFVMGKAGRVGVARRTFQATDAQAGIFRGMRNFFNGPTASRFLDNNPALIDRLVSIRDPYDIARLTNFQLDPSMTRALAGASRPTDIRGIITAGVERGQLRRTTQLTGTNTQRALNWADTVRSLRPNYTPRAVRILQPMPQEYMDINNPRQVADNLVRTLNNAHAPEEDIRAVYNQVANSTNRVSVFNAVVDAQGRVGNMLRHYGLENEDAINFLTRVHQETRNEHLSGLYDDIGTDMPTWEHIQSNGSSVFVAGPHLPTEYLERVVHIPNIREVRRMTSRYGFLTRKMGSEFGEASLPLAMMDFMTSRVLKPLWLMRLAWPIRVIGEEQIRMSAAGLDSAFSGHPISWLSFAVGSRQNRMSDLLERLPGIKAQSEITLSGAMFDELDEFQKGVYNTHRAWLDRNGAIPIPHRTLYNRTIPDEVADFRHAWAEEFNMLFHDPISNYVATHTMDEATSWLWRGKGRQWRDELQHAHGPNNLADRNSVRAYVQQVSERIGRITSHDTDLLDVLRTGTFNTPTGRMSINKGATNQLAPEFTQHLDSYLNLAPTKIAGNKWSTRGLRGQFGGRWDQTLDRIFGTLMGTPTATLSRAPAFKQFYWKRAASLLPFAEPLAQARILTNARKSNLPNRTIRALEHGATTRSGRLTLDEMEILTKGYALDDTKGLLYDISERGQAADILRNVVPFAEAWREVLTRWSTLVVQGGGKPVRRLQQLVQGARGEEFGDVMGAPGDNGFFYQNEFGEEVFAYPGAQWLMNKETNIPLSPFNLPGVPVPLTGRVQGLNMFGTIVPSLGPVASIPVAWFLQDKPQYDWWREQLLPFGGPGAEEASSILELRDYLPAYMKTAVDTFFEGGNDDRVYDSSVMYVASYLYSTGDYGNTVDEQQRLMEDARNKAQDVYAIRALGQFILPASPAPTWLIQDQTGQLLSQRLLSQEFYQEILPSAQGYQEAVEQFLEDYGTEAIGAIIPHSQAIIPNIPTSLEAAQWVADNPSIRNQYPLVYGMFAPEGEFHMPTYIRNFTTEEREPFTPEQWQMLRDNTLANYWYERQKLRLGVDADSPSDEQAIWLRDQRERIQETFPFWGNRTGQGESPDVDVLIRELYRTLDNETLMETEAGQGLQEYLRYRDLAVQQSIEWSDTNSPTSFRSAQALAGTRQWLRSQAERIMERYPAFRALWDHALDREFLVEDIGEGSSAGS